MRMRSIAATIGVCVALAAAFLGAAAATSVAATPVTASPASPATESSVAASPTSESPPAVITEETTAVPGTFPAAGLPDDGAQQTYSVEYDMFNRDVTGTLLNRVRLTGDYHRLLEGGAMRWNGVELAGGGPDGSLAPAAPVVAMEDFGYALGMEIVEEPLYERFDDPNVRQLAKSLVWDAAMLEAFDLLLDSFASLDINVPARVDEYEDFDVRMGEWGSLTMRDLEVTWVGESTMNGEPCVVVLYESWSNPVDAGPTRGRSCYWGQFWVSREDGNIERLTLNEDVLLEMPAGPDATTVLNMQRAVAFEKTG